MNHHVNPVSKFSEVDLAASREIRDGTVLSKYKETSHASNTTETTTSNSAFESNFIESSTDLSNEHTNPLNPDNIDLVNNELNPTALSSRQNNQKSKSERNSSNTRTLKTNASKLADSQDLPLKVDGVLNEKLIFANGNVIHNKDLSKADPLHPTTSTNNNSNFSNHQELQNTQTRIPSLASSLPNPNPLETILNNRTSSASLKGVGIVPPSINNAEKGIVKVNHEIPSASINIINSSNGSAISMNLIKSFPNSQSILSHNRNNAIMVDSPHYGRGELIVTVYPLNRSCVWLTPAKFDCQHVPSEILDPKLEVTADDYSLIMELITNDYRFTCYNMFYKRILLSWLLFGLLILIAILFSGLSGPILFGMGILWLIVNTLGVFLCVLIKKKMNFNLDEAVSTVNRILFKKNILVGLEDKGKLSCHKLKLHLIYYNIDDCLSQMVRIVEKKGIKCVKNVNGDINSVTIAKVMDFRHKNQDLESIVDGTQTNYRLNNYHSYAEKVLLRNSQSYVKNLIRGRLTIPHPDLPHSKNIRHVKGNFCLCQYVEDYYFIGKSKRWYEALL